PGRGRSRRALRRARARRRRGGALAPSRGARRGRHGDQSRGRDPAGAAVERLGAHGALAPPVLPARLAAPPSRRRRVARGRHRGVVGAARPYTSFVHTPVRISAVTHDTLWMNLWVKNSSHVV